MEADAYGSSSSGKIVDDDIGNIVTGSDGDRERGTLRMVDGVN